MNTLTIERSPNAVTDYTTLKTRLTINTSVYDRLIDFMYFGVRDVEYDSQGYVTSIGNVPQEVTDLLNEIFDLRKKDESYEVTVKFVMDAPTAESASRIIWDKIGCYAPHIKVKKEEQP